MPTIGSNQYPALPWEDNPDPVHGGVIARPHGHMSSVRVYYAAYYPPQLQWVWVVNWTGRFHLNASAADQQAAMDQATVEYWDQIAATECWVQPPDPPAPPPLPPEVLAWRQKIEDWLASGPTDPELRMELANMQDGPAIVSEAENAWAYACIMRALADWRRPTR